jgi:hypothetical protein
MLAALELATKASPAAHRLCSRADFDLERERGRIGPCGCLNQVAVVNKSHGCGSAFACCTPVDSVPERDHHCGDPSLAGEAQGARTLCGCEHSEATRFTRQVADTTTHQKQPLVPWPVGPVLVSTACARGRKFSVPWPLASA